MQLPQRSLLFAFASALCLLAGARSAQAQVRRTDFTSDQYYWVAWYQSGPEAGLWQLSGDTANVASEYLDYYYTTCSATLYSAEITVSEPTTLSWTYWLDNPQYYGNSISLLLNGSQVWTVDGLGNNQRGTEYGVLAPGEYSLSFVFNKQDGYMQPVVQGSISDIGFGNPAIFMTQGTYPGNQVSTAAANTICKNEASSAGYSGYSNDFKAWISTSSLPAASNFTNHWVIPYVDVEGNEIAANWTGLTSGTLLNGISYDEFGDAIPAGRPAWTDSTPAGALANSTYSCNNWTSNTSTGIVGLSGSTTASWSNAGTSRQDLYWCSGDGAEQGESWEPRLICIYDGPSF